MTGERILKIRVDWDRTALVLPPLGFKTVHIGPEPGYPAGRKGLQLAGAWKQLAGPDIDGMLILDGDVAADPLDVAQMLVAAEAEPGAVHTAPVLLWPASTGAPRWVWGHGCGEFSQDDTGDPDRFSFCLTYLPRQLIEACDLEPVTFPHVDAAVSATARELGIPVRVVRGANPKHVNY